MPSSLTLENPIDRPSQNRGQILALALLLALAVFVLDLFVPLGIAEAVPYVAVVLVALRSPDKNDPLRLAGLCTVLTLIGYGLSPSGTETWVAITNRAIALFAIWSTTILAMQVKEADSATRDQSSMLTGILSNMPAVAFRLDQEGVMRESIGSGLSRLGLKDHKSIGRIPLEPPDRIKTQVKEGALPRAVFYESNGILQGKPWWFLNCLCKPADANQGIIGFGIDITERKQAERRLAMHDAVSNILTNSSHIRKSYPQILTAIVTTLEWKAGILWHMDYKNQSLKSVRIWPSSSPQSQSMADSGGGQWTLTPGVGLAGRAWDSQKSVWMQDLAQDAKDPRHSLALDSGFHAAFAVPISLGGQTHAVLECFSAFSEEPDETLLQMLSNIGFQISQSIEREHKEQRLAAHHAITDILAESPDFTHASPLIIEAICDNLEWDLGGIWKVDASEQVLRCINTWHASGLKLDAFKQVSQETTFARGVGLPGRVWKRGEPAWITDVVADPNFPRATIAAKEGLHAAFAFPIKFGSEVLGVMEFFHHEIQKPDKELLHMFASIGLQIGQFMHQTIRPPSDR